MTLLKINILHFRNSYRVWVDRVMQASAHPPYYMLQVCIRNVRGPTRYFRVLHGAYEWLYMKI